MKLFKLNSLPFKKNCFYNIKNHTFEMDCPDRNSGIKTE